MEWVDRLPRLNLRDAILTTPEAARHFQTDIEQFLPMYLKIYFLPRALRASIGGRLYLLQGRRAARYLRTAKLAACLPLPQALEGQRTIARQLFAAVDLFSSLGNLLNKNAREHFHVASFLSMLEKPFSLDEYLLALNGPDKYLEGPRGKISITGLRMLAGYLFEKGRFLWPLWPIEGEQRWSKFPIDYGFPFGRWLLLPFAGTAHLRDQQKMLLLRTLRATTWSGWKDITDDDIVRLREKFQEQRDLSASYATTLNHIVRKARELGNPLTYETRGTRLSKTKYRGRDGPSFAFFQAAAEKSSIVRYWVNQAGHFYRFEKDQGQRQRLDPLNRALSTWLDYVCDLDRIGQAPSSISEVTNRLHIRLPGPGWISTFPSFTSWGKQKGVGKGRVWSSLILVRQFFAWIIRNEDLNIVVPVDDFDLPSRPQSRKSDRPALTTQCWKGLRTLILEDPVRVTERFQDASGKRIEVLSPTFQAYLLMRLETGIRDMQARYLDKNKVLGKDGFVISGDKNIHRKVLQVIPYFDPALKEKVQQCIDYQNTYNRPTEPVWYGGNENSPFGKVDPLFRFIGHNPDPICALTFKIYFIRTLLKYQKKAELTGNHQLVRYRGGTAIDMSMVDSDNLTAVEVLDRFETPFDLPSLRVTAATVWFEAPATRPSACYFITFRFGMRSSRSRIASLG